MSGFNHGFEKYIHLPTCGLTYDPICWLKPVSSEFNLAQYDTELYNSNLEFMVSIIKKYATLKVDITDLFISDFFYIWSVIRTGQTEGKAYYYDLSSCAEKDCGETNRLLIELAKFKVTLFNPLTDKADNFLHKKIIYNNYELCFHLRTVKDCFLFSNLILSCNNLIDLHITYLCVQLDYIKDINTQQIINKDEYFYFFRSTKVKYILNVYETIRQFNNTIGIKNKTQYYCVKCRSQNNFLLYDDFSLSVLSPHIHSKSAKYQLEELYKIHIMSVQYGWLSLDNILSIPIKDVDVYIKALNRVDFLPKVGSALPFH